MERTEQIIGQTERYGATNYNPLPIVIVQAEGVWAEDAEGRRYLDMLSAYSAVNHGHRHKKIIKALLDQADRVTLTSRAFHHDRAGEWYEMLSQLTGKTTILPMNTGAEAVETALKAARRWAYQVKGVPDMQAEIIVCANNFHGRTLSITSFSTEPAYKFRFGPFTPGFVTVPFGDAEALRRAITPHTAAFLFEPIQGEAGVIIPPNGYLREAAAICREHQVLMMADEIQTGLGRTGQRFACDWENVVPDVYILGKALGGGVLPVSAVAADREVLGVFNAGSHGSTFGGNPLACAVSIAALQVLDEEKLEQRARIWGDYMLKRLKRIRSPRIRDIRGRGLLIGIELDEEARPYCHRLMELGVLCKETHANIIRIAPPLTIMKDEIDWALMRVESALTERG
ncbi:ornithine--oxo-acid transaminase [Paenibacillus sp. LMG 31456]|uniref:Ornithine aminotransferase n=1 Tax=Paenibacillus foliorum TaxID=2654974 RepID=A0A972GQT8_9BACL|nr:ornithine--oxo-acid transaminase [Paenibacillus foliorum]NOU94490.1 ornithine--oxo-acid transaminase [Paenibacillus foliorum]